MFMKLGRRRNSAAQLLIAALATFSLCAPVFAVDTGGGGGTSGGGSTGGTSSGGSSGSSSSGNSSGSSSNSTTASTPSATINTTSPKAVPIIDLNSARRLIARKQWDAAIKLLRVIVVQQPKNADALNLLGYSLRQKGEMKEAEAWYLKALKLKPTHLGANEYLGELYVLTGEKAKAQARLDALAKICGNTTCEEYQDLAKAIAAKA